MNRSFYSRVILVAVFLFASTGLAFAQEETPVFVVLDYMKVQPGMDGEYVDLEADIWKRMHQERVDRGDILGWNLYAVTFPGGTQHTYNYVTATTYSDLSNLQDVDFEAIGNHVHSDKALNELASRTLTSRDHVGRKCGSCSIRWFLAKKQATPADSSSSTL